MLQVEKIKTTGYLILQIFFILTLLLLPRIYVISSSLVMFLLGITLLMNSHKLINESKLSGQNIYTFILILFTIFFIPAHAAFHNISVKFVAISLIIAHLVAIFLFLSPRLNDLKNKKQDSLKVKPKFKDLLKEKELARNSSFAQRQTASIKKIVKKKIKKKDYKLAAIVGGSKFHSLDCKMIENKPKKRIKYYASAQQALNDGLKPCKLCKAVNFLHQL